MHNCPNDFHADLTRTATRTPSPLKATRLVSPQVLQPAVSLPYLAIATFEKNFQFEACRIYIRLMRTSRFISILQGFLFCEWHFKVKCFYFMGILPSYHRNPWWAHKVARDMTADFIRASFPPLVLSSVLQNQFYHVLRQSRRRRRTWDSGTSI